ncbi:Sodium-coupled monocarboxylate transporter 1 [Armadillidium nasatum]|uniref:Sodium-coupled monocarboxylate transporter 1 n=1 Tax=Armadillidium nasatum TaxID=96803 RepID=A0A5N5SVP3_9CRUS|nr:Sodium-coupled monocarboxylate transporter 1 [Armadillidium nasatum]
MDLCRVLVYTLIGYFILNILLFSGGIVLYASYKGCDPVLEGKIESYNQLLSFFIMNKLNIVGLPGIFSATLLASTLSTFSSSLNGIVSITWKVITINTDFFPTENPSKCTVINKILIIVYGTIFIGMAFLSSKVKSIIQFVLTFEGITLGPILGVYLLGFFVSYSNGKVNLNVDIYRFCFT